MEELIVSIGTYRTGMLFLICFALGAGGALLIARFPFRRHLLDHPNNRSSHEVPTPRGGGIGILAAFIAAAITLQAPLHLLAAGVLVSLVSFFGDFFKLSVTVRLIFQAAASFICLFPLLPRLGEYYDVSLLAAYPFFFPLLLVLLLVCIVGTANFYNFMDGINGIAAITGVCGFGILGLYTLNRPALSEPELSLALLSLCVASACLGFLPFNVPRARVFMGDVGSILLGFLFAVLMVMLARNYRDMLCFAALLFPFYADTVTTVYLRFKEREPLSQPHRRHLYQLLVNEYGMAHWKVAASYGMAQATIGVAALLANTAGLHFLLFVLAASCAASILLQHRVRNKLRQQGQEPPKSGR